jgi:hypothetical protein
LIKQYESKCFDNLALQIILKNCPDAGTRKTWESDLQRFRETPARQTFHDLFVSLYAQIDSAISDSEVAALLAKFPPEGMPN